MKDTITSTLLTKNKVEKYQPKIFSSKITWKL